MLAEQKDKVERKLKKVKIDLMRNPKFALWSGIMMVGKTEISDDIPTACTNGRDEMYGREFIKGLTDKELAFVILHENMHKALRHLTIWRKLWDADKRLANMACDYVINLMIVDSDPTEQWAAFPRDPKGERIGCFDVRFRGMNAKQVFDILKQEQQENGGKGGEGEGEGGEGEGEGGEGFDDHDWDGAKGLSPEEKKELEREIDQAIRQGMMAEKKAIGKGAGNMSRELGDLLEPQIDWREVLREFVKSICNARDTSSWRRVNRRFLGSDTYMPTMIGERVGSLAIGVDTSGSISGKEINRFLSEVKSIAEDVRPEKIDLIYWDAHVAAHETYDENDMANIVSSTKPKGGGGTDPRAMMHYLKTNKIEPECIIMLTDGEIYDWGSDWDAPIMWVVCNSYRGSKITAPVGKTVHIKDN
jgi:predicted metal-dependent peptidase